MERKRRGDGDFIGHSLDLFIDFVQVFRKILIILMQKVMKWTHLPPIVPLIYSFILFLLSSHQERRVKKLARMNKLSC